MGERRFSRQRERIYQAVRASQVHPTAQMVYEELRAQMPRLSLGTVYRNLIFISWRRKDCWWSLTGLWRALMRSFGRTPICGACAAAVWRTRRWPMTAVWISRPPGTAGRWRATA